MIGLKTASGLERVQTARVLTSGGLERFQQAFIRTADGLKPLFSTVSVTVSPAGAGGGGASANPILITSSSVTAVPAGGVSPYSYAWAEVTGSGDITAGSPTGQSSTFSALVDPHDGISATWKVTVTDATGQSADSAAFPISLNNYGQYGG